jgi:hypothetical protein
VTDPTDRQLFFSSTWVQIGDEKVTPFWEAKWLLGSAPKELAPHLYEVDKFKKIIVYTELTNINWIRSLQHISSCDQIDEFTLLFMALVEIQLNDHNDSIYWKWTANGKFLVASTYECQFQGSMTPFPASDIWTSYSERKNQFFAWLVMHNRVLIEDNILKKNWHCNQFCSFCLCLEETTQHLLTDCNYTEAVWNLVAPHFNLPSYQILQLQGEPIQWFQAILQGGSAKEKKRRTGILITVWWMIWKERNR